MSRLDDPFLGDYYRLLAQWLLGEFMFGIGLLAYALVLAR